MPGFVLFAGVVGARDLTMECRKGRRKGLLSGLVFAWLVTSGCTVAARNIGEWQSIYDFTADSKPAESCPHRLCPSLCQLSLPGRGRVREYLQARVRPAREKLPNRSLLTTKRLWTNGRGRNGRQKTDLCRSASPALLHPDNW